MAIMDLFYTDKCKLMGASQYTSDKYGIYILDTTFLYDEEFPCCITPISTTKAREKYGIGSSTSFEISMDIFDGLDVRSVYSILYDSKEYIVQSYQVYSEFLILPKSVTFLVEKRDR